MTHKIFENDTLLMLLLAAALVVTSILVLNYAFQPTMDAVEWRETTYRVREGDSLWTISSKYCPGGVDRREWIDEIRELNGLDNCIIYPGQELTVLKAKESKQ